MISYFVYNFNNCIIYVTVYKNTPIKDIKKKEIINMFEKVRCACCGSFTIEYEYKICLIYINKNKCKGFI